MIHFEHLSDAEVILLVLAAFYLSECVAWLREGAVWFVPSFGGRCRPVRSGMSIGPDRGGLVLINILPMGQAFLCEPWPVSVSPEGLYSYIAPTFSPRGRPDQPGRYLRFAEVAEVENVGNEVHVNGRSFVKVGSPDHAAFVAESLRRLSATPEQKREAAILDLLARITDVAEVEAHLGELDRNAGHLKATCTLLFLHVFALGPALLYTFRLHPLSMLVLSVYLFVLLVWWIEIIIVHARVHRTLAPEATSSRRKLVLTMVFSPVAAMRAWSVLARHRLPSHHPLATAGVLCSRPTTEALVRMVLRDALNPIAPACPTDEPSPSATEAWFRARLTDALFRLTSRIGLDPEALTAPPTPEPGALAFCPRCADQYDVAEGVCFNCGGLPLQRFDTPLPIPSRELIPGSPAGGE